MDCQNEQPNSYFTTQNSLLSRDIFYSEPRKDIDIFTYNRLNDYFASLTDTYGEGKTVMTTKNIGRQQQLDLGIIYSRRLASWWDVNAHTGLYYFVNQLDYEAYREHYKHPSVTLSMSNDIALPYKIRLELSGRFYSKRQGGSYEVARSSGSVDAGFSRFFAKQNRLHLSLVMTDIFHTERWDSYGTKGNLSLDSWGYGESRQVIFKIRYHFGKQKFTPNKTTIEKTDRL